MPLEDGRKNARHFANLIDEIQNSCVLASWVTKKLVTLGEMKIILLWLQTDTVYAHSTINL